MHHGCNAWIMRKIHKSITIAFCVVASLSHASGITPIATGQNAPTQGIGPAELAVIINDNDPESVKIGHYYQARRLIPKGNMIHVKFTPRVASLPQLEFEKIKAVVDRATPGHIQAYALAWTMPYRAGCMSITTAFAAGFNEAFWMVMRK